MTLKEKLNKPKNKSRIFKINKKKWLIIIVHSKTDKNN